MTGSPLYGNSMASAPQALQMAYMRDPRVRLSQQLQLQGTDSSPVQHWTQGAARLAQALLGMHSQDKADADYTKQAEAYQADQKALYAPVQQMQPSPAGAGPRPGAQMTSRPPTLQEMLARGQSMQSPYSQDAIRQLQMMNAQQEAEAAKRGTWKAGEQNGLKGQMNSATGEFKPDPLPRASNQPRFTFQNINGQLVAIDQSDPTKQMPLGRAGAPEAPPNPNAGPFSGSAMDAQDSNILLRGDPSSQEYALAYSRQFGPRAIQQPDGTTVTIMPPVPEGIAKPGTRAAAQNPLAQFSIGGQGNMPMPAPAGVPAAPQTAAPNSATMQLPGGGSVTRTGDPTPKPLTETQGKAGGFADRMANSDQIINRLGDVGTSYAQRGLAAVPGVGNAMVNQDYQSFDQARRDFINATLRRESGAVISPQEFDNAEKQYFPQPGDSKETIAQKARNRRITLEGIAREAGPSYKMPGSVNPPIGGGAVADNNDPLGLR